MGIENKNENKNKNKNKKEQMKEEINRMTQEALLQNSMNAGKVSVKEMGNESVDLPEYFAHSHATWRRRSKKGQNTDPGIIEIHMDNGIWQLCEIREYKVEAAGWYGRCLAMKSAHTQGSTRVAVIDNLKDVIELCLETEDKIRKGLDYVDTEKDSIADKPIAVLLKEGDLVICRSLGALHKQKGKIIEQLPTVEISGRRWPIHYVVEFDALGEFIVSAGEIILASTFGQSEGPKRVCPPHWEGIDPLSRDIKL